MKENKIDCASIIQISNSKICYIIRYKNLRGKLFTRNLSLELGISNLKGRVNIFLKPAAFIPLKYLIKYYYWANCSHFHRLNDGLNTGSHGSFLAHGSNYRRNDY